MPTASWSLPVGSMSTPTTTARSRGTTDLEPSVVHGVTTLVMGNCGVGFAPVRRTVHDCAHRPHGGRRGHPRHGPGGRNRPGEWETFPEYLDTLERRRWTVDVGTQVPHGAVRGYVMGERGAKNEAARPRTSRRCGPSSSTRCAPAPSASPPRARSGTAPVDGEVVPGTYAAEDELFGIGSALGEARTGVFELAPLGSAGEQPDDVMGEVDWMRRLSAAIDRPVSFALLQVDAAPDLWRQQMAESLEACAEGAQLYPQVAGRPTGLLTGHHATICLFADIPAYRELRARGLTPAEFGDALADPDVRRAIVSWVPSSPGVAEAMERAYKRTFVLGDPPDYEPGPERSLAGLAAASGVSPLEVAYDEMAKDGGTGLLYLPILNYATGDLDHVYDMLLHPQGLLGLSDGGAHTGTICDGSMPTFMLTHWTRDRRRGATLPLEYVVKKQTHDTARLYGMSDRGTVEPGALADFNLIDYDGLSLGVPFVRADLPAGGRRLLQKASGYVATIKKGTVTFEQGEPSGELPGRLVRGAR